MKIPLLKRLVSPAAMSDALARKEVGRIGHDVYTIIFALPIVLAFLITFTDNLPPADTYTFPHGLAIDALCSLVFFFAYFIAPIKVAFKKVTRKEYAKYFIALNAPLFILAMLASIVVGIAFAILQGTTDTAISLSHLVFANGVLLLQAFAMPYYMQRTIRLTREEAKAAG